MQVADLLGKEQYEFGDISREIARRIGGGGGGGAEVMPFDVWHSAFSKCRRGGGGGGGGGRSLEDFKMVLTLLRGPRSSDFKGN